MIVGNDGCVVLVMLNDDNLGLLLCWALEANLSHRPLMFNVWGVLSDFEGGGVPKVYSRKYPMFESEIIFEDKGNDYPDYLTII